MQIDFPASDFANWDHVVVRWYQGGSSPVYTQTQSTFNVTTVSPGNYRLAGSAVQKPSTPSGVIPGTYTITLAGQNPAGTGPEGAPSAPFLIGAPAAPGQPVVSNPNT